MSNKVKDKNIKNRTYSFSMILSIQKFLIRIILKKRKSHKNIFIYYIGYATIKKYVKIYSINSLYLIFRNVNGYLEEINENKYLTLVSTNESKGKRKTYEQLWIRIRDLIRQ